MDNQDAGKELVSRSVLWIVVGVSLLVAGIVLARQLHIVWNIWPSADGVVVRGTVEEILEAPYAKGGMPVHRYAPRIEFDYAAGGRNYQAEAASVYLADTYEDAAATLGRLYAPGTHHPIRYNPRDPRDIEFGTIEFSSLAFAFLVLVGGVALAAVGLSIAARGYAKPVEVAREEQGMPAPVLPFAVPTKQDTALSMRRCPACGRPVKITEDTCPNCLKFLRAA